MTSKNMYELRMGVWEQVHRDTAPGGRLAAAPKPTCTIYQVRKGKDWCMDQTETELSMDVTLFKTRRFPHTDVGVMRADTLTAAASLVEQGQMPLVLNMSDDCFAGGNVDTGSGAQEENLYRRTNLCLVRAVNQHAYPLTPCKLVLNKNVTVYRADEAHDYRCLRQPYKVDIVSLPGIRNPKIDDGALSKPDTALLAARLRLLFRTAAREGYSVLVLGPIGCGVWHNPPESVARVFKALLCEFSGVFRGVFFPILAEGAEGAEGPEETGAKGSNLQVFTNVLVNDTPRR
jgi:uncharacterized protein (TIGR02452 family)